LNGSGMPFYDAYTTSLFQATYGRPLHVFADGKALPAQYPEECGFLAGLIGAFTNAVIDYVRGRHPSARFEILYAPDVNEAPLNGPVNLPSRDWTPTKIDCFKTENFTYTGDRNLDKARQSVLLPGQLGFSSTNASHLVGIGDHTTPWVNEYVYAKGLGVESVVLFALDQFCLIGYELPLSSGSRRSLFMGA